mmetsp:Transcript_35528/g.56887  ORF Transcript_35528/g.56887 Transcript_35528/m.56887 type:complete len:81 (-) Transcript_35528:5041-5283(-)
MGVRGSFAKIRKPTPVQFSTIHPPALLLGRLGRTFACFKPASTRQVVLQSSCEKLTLSMFRDSIFTATLEGSCNRELLVR